MIIRILGEGQYDVADSELDALNSLDDTLQTAVESKDDSSFSSALGALLDSVRSSGSQLADDELCPSDLVLPSSDSSLDDVQQMLAEDGLIPG